MPTAERRATRRQQLAEVLELHASGLSIRAIARRLDLRIDRAAKLLTEGIASLPAQDHDELRATSELRLDKISEVWSSLLDSEDERTRAQAAEGLRRVENDRARLLGTWMRPPKATTDDHGRDDGRPCRRTPS